RFNSFCYDDDDDDEDYTIAVTPTLSTEELTNDDSFSIDNIEYVETSPLDSELVSSEVMEIVIPEVGGIDDDILLTRRPPQEMSIQEMKDLKQQYLDEMKRLINSEYRDEIKINELKGNFNITPTLSTEEPDNSLSMEDEHLNTIPATDADEFIKSSVKNLIPIPSESEGIPDNMCDVPFHDNSPPRRFKRSI
nr:hypothetical protein [Tanacetum cinerariifolium]